MQFHPKDLSELDDLTEEHLGFSALSDGLGFTRSAKKAPQPNSALDRDSEDDPALRIKSFSGTGAVAAGPARPVFTRKVLVTNVLSEPAAPRIDRIAAFMIDFFVISVPLTIGWWVSFGSQSIEIFREDRRPPLFLFFIIFGVYFLLSESFGGQSIGKMFMNLRVVEDDKYQKPTGLTHAAKRMALFMVSVIFLGLGFFASFWDAKRRPWHDLYSGSIVRKKA